MRTLNLAASAAEDALVTLAGHVGLGTEIGRPVLAMPGDDGSVTVLVDVGPDETALWSVNTIEASRVLPLERGRVELTRWREGEETFRTISDEIGDSPASG